MSCRRPDRTSHEASRFVAWVPVSGVGAFDVSYARVVCLDLDRSGGGDYEDFDLLPPPAYGEVELVGLWPRRSLNKDAEFSFRDSCVGERARAEQDPAAVL